MSAERLRCSKLLFEAGDGWKMVLVDRSIIYKKNKKTLTTEIPTEPNEKTP